MNFFLQTHFSVDYVQNFVYQYITSASNSIRARRLCYIWFQDRKRCRMLNWRTICCHTLGSCTHITLSYSYCQHISIYLTRLISLLTDSRTEAWGHTESPGCLAIPLKPVNTDKCEQNFINSNPCTGCLVQANKLESENKIKLQ